MDEVIPVDAMLIAREQLAQAGLPVEWHVAPGVGHGIDGDGLAARRRVSETGLRLTLARRHSSLSRRAQLRLTRQGAFGSS